MTESAYASVCNFIKKETLAQLFSCEFWEIFKNTFFIEHIPVTASSSNIKNCNAHDDLTAGKI